ncbi:hypothetical protein SCB17_003100 [Clostridium perfringens]|nr:hypothetical protein [Clostridium perfringens]
MKFIIKLLYVQYIGIKMFLCDFLELLKSIKNHIESALDEIIEDYEERYKE